MLSPKRQIRDFLPVLIIDDIIIAALAVPPAHITHSNNHSPTSRTGQNSPVLKNCKTITHLWQGYIVVVTFLFMRNSIDSLRHHILLFQ